MYVCTKTEDSTLVGRAVLLLAVWRGLVSWRVVRGVASHARADNIDAGAGRGGEAHGRRRGASAAHHERMRDERAREAAAGEAELPPRCDTRESRWDSRGARPALIPSRLKVQCAIVL